MTDRTPEQYAIEFGEYLATAAEAYMLAINKYSAGEEDSDYLSDHWRALQNAVGEFRKRAERCKWNFKYTEMAPPIPPRSEWPKIVRKTDCVCSEGTLDYRTCPQHGSPTTYLGLDTSS